ncbi:hypothetical protein F7232_09160 [Corynebacterium sp. 319]|uniref:hypothetical protein n=1 Tax=unclassified Corynebacterium TaxID=2624378 RepID=UPI00125CB9CB|nr:MULTISPECIES: hypothetical protein [unclassified Corynebacterium]KAB1550446.1 hypothetical protein F7232_09160 [Corynebacterium sp. 319]KAB1554823.1 hypothetical protein F7233_00665 [Corynebacterium sp. 321]KAB3539795.1 hypothetical protein F8390_00400 [Corynebacterium sp. 366]
MADASVRKGGGMELSIRGIRYDTARDIESTALSSMFWQIPHSDANTCDSIEDPQFEKELWIQRVLMEWGTCAYTAFVSTGDEGSTPLPAATVVFAPSNYLPGSGALPTAPVSPDAILITNVYVALPYMGLYLEHRLIDTVLEEAKRRGVKAVEAFARAEDLDHSLVEELMHAEGNTGTSAEGEGSDDLGEKAGTDPAAGGVDTHVGAQQETVTPTFFAEAYGGWEPPQESAANEKTSTQLEHAPMLSEDILEEQGFTVVKAHPRFPRYRKEIDAGAGLFGRVEADDHEHLTGREALGTVMGGRAHRTPQPTFLRLGDDRLFRR